MQMKECRTKNKSHWVLFVLMFTAVSLSGCFYADRLRLQHVTRGEEYLKERKFQEATLEFRAAIDLDKTSAPAHWGLARAYEGQEKIYETIDELQKTIQFDKQNLDARNKLASYYLLVQPTRIDEAEKLLAEIFAIDPNYIEGHILQASILSAKNAPEKDVLETLERAILLDKTRVESYLSLARFYVKQKRNDDAEKTYQRAIAADANSALAYVEFGRFMAYVDRPGDAENQLKKAVEVESGNRDALEALANFYLGTKQIDKAEGAYKNLAALDKSSTGSAVLGDFYSSIGKTDQAIQIYEEILQNEPSFARGRYRLGEIFLQKGDLAKVREQADEVLKRNDKDSQGLLLRARVGLREGKNDEALKDLETLLKQEPSSKFGLYYMTETRMNLGQFDQAKNYLTDLERFHQNFLFAKLQRVQLNLANGENTGALRLANELLEILKDVQPNSDISERGLADLKANALSARGTANLLLAKIAEAKNDFQIVQQMAPNSPSSYLNLAKIAVTNRNLGESQTLYEKVLSLDTNNFDGLSGLVNVYLQTRKFAEAHSQIQKALPNAAAQNQPALHFLKSQVFTAENNLSGAEAEITKSLEIDPEYLPAYTAYASLLINQNQIERALEQYKISVQKKPSAAISTLIAMLEDGRGNAAESEKNYREALRLSPGMAIAANNLAWLIASTGGNLDEAVGLAEGVVEKNPNEASYLDTLGFVFLKRGFNAQAVEYLKKAVVLDSAQAVRAGRSPNPGYRVRLAMALASSGDKASSRKEAENALRDEKKLSQQEVQDARNLMKNL